jgi:hypothetical protein
MIEINDFEHFVLQPGEVLILRSKRMLSTEEMGRAKQALEAALPGRPVLVLSPDMEVMAGVVEVFGAEEDEGREQLDKDAIATERALIEQAYQDGKLVYGWNRKDKEPFFVHVRSNPEVFDWDKNDYSLTKPKWAS